MSSLFDLIKIYTISSYKVTNREFISAQDKAQIISAEVVKSDYGLSAKLTLTHDRIAFIPLSRDSKLSIGDTIDLNKVVILTLTRDGDEIKRLEEI